jgi:hypothetical protein
MSVEYGAGTLIGAVRSARIAPVSFEMILHYTAQHTLGLPKAYENRQCGQPSSRS